MPVRWTGQTHHQSPIFETTWTPSLYYHICQMRKKRKHSFSDEEDPDIIMLDSLAVDKIDDGTDPRDNTGGSSSTTQHQFRHKNKKRKKDNTNSGSDADSGESEKEDIVMDNTKEETKENSGTIKVCFLIFVMHVHADIASLIE